MACAAAASSQPSQGTPSTLPHVAASPCPCFVPDFSVNLPNLSFSLNEEILSYFDNSDITAIGLPDIETQELIVRIGMVIKVQLAKSEMQKTKDILTAQQILTAKNRITEVVQDLSKLLKKLDAFEAFIKKKKTSQELSKESGLLQKLEDLFKQCQACKQRLLDFKPKLILSEVPATNKFVNKLNSLTDEAVRFYSKEKRVLLDIEESLFDHFDFELTSL